MLVDIAADVDRFELARRIRESEEQYAAADRLPVMGGVGARAAMAMG